MEDLPKQWQRCIRQLMQHRGQNLRCMACTQLSLVSGLKLPSVAELIVACLRQRLMEWQEALQVCQRRGGAIGGMRSAKLTATVELNGKLRQIVIGEILVRMTAGIMAAL